MCIKMNKRIYNFNLQCPENKAYLSYTYDCGLDYECEEEMERKRILANVKTTPHWEETAKKKRQQVEKLWSDYDTTQ